MRVAKDLFYDSGSDFSLMDIVEVSDFKDLPNAIIDANKTFSDQGRTIDVQSLLKSYTNQKDKNILTKIANYLRTPDEDIKDPCTSIILKY